MSVKNIFAFCKYVYEVCMYIMYRTLKIIIYENDICTKSIVSKSIVSNNHTNVIQLKISIITNNRN